MRHRPVENPEPHLACAVTLAPPLREQTLAESLLELGLPPENVAAAEALFVAGAMELAQRHQHRWLNDLLGALGGCPAGKALRRALVGAGGQSFAADAAEVGCDRANLRRAELRIRQRLVKNGLQAAQ